jgi:hypothetical protein
VDELLGELAQMANARPAPANLAAYVAKTFAEVAR